MTITPTLPLVFFRYMNSAVYICENMSSRQPVTEVSEFESQLA